MSNTKTNNDGNKNKLPPHDRLLADVRRLTHLKTEDGKRITFGSTMKIVYAYLITFQENKNRANYPAAIYPNMEAIAWECGITKPTAQKAINDLVAAGVVEKKSIQVASGFKSNAYIVLKQADVFSRGETPPKPVKGKESKAKSKKNQEKQEDGKSEMQAKPKEPKQAATAATPADQNPDLAAGSAASIVGQHDRVASNDDSGGDAGTDGATSVNPEEEQEEAFPWMGGAFIGSGRLSENAYQWALTAGATDWRHACCLVWDRVRVTPPDEINEDRKPLSLC